MVGVIGWLEWALFGCDPSLGDFAIAAAATAARAAFFFWEKDPVQIKDCCQEYQADEEVVEVLHAGYGVWGNGMR
jgi:hypothetical protein